MCSSDLYYPEILHSAYVVNGKYQCHAIPDQNPPIVIIISNISASWIFSYIFAILKPILSSRTLDKVKIFSSDASQWKLALLESMRMTSLPKEYQNDQNDNVPL